MRQDRDRGESLVYSSMVLIFMHPLYSCLQAACLLLRGPKPSSTNLDTHPPLHLATETQESVIPQSHIHNIHLASPLPAPGQGWGVSGELQHL